MGQGFPGQLCSVRLSLRRLGPEEAAELCAYRSLPEVSRYQYWDHFGPEDAARLIKEQAVAQPNIPGTWFQLVIVKADTGCVMGDCGLHCLDSHQMEIGITLAPRHQGRRYP